MIRVRHLTILAFLAAILCTAGAVEAATIAKPTSNNSLVGFWPFDEGIGTLATDHSGYGNGATLTCTGGGCAIPTWIAGKHGKGLDFSYLGPSTYSLLTVPASVPAASGNVVSVSVWYYNKGGGGDSRIVNRGWCASMGWLMHIGYGFGVNNSTGCAAQHWASFGSMETGRWYHLAGVFDGTNVYSYKDGVLMNTAPTSGVNLANNNYTIEMMTSNNGKLDDVRIYNRVLSASEVLRTYKAGQTTRKTANNSGLVGYWSFNEGVGLLAGDFSGNGYGGTLVGGPAWVNGKRGKALSFDNVDDYVNVGDQPNLDFGTGDFTISAFQTKNSNIARVLVEKRGTGLVGYMLAEEYPSTGNVTIFLNDTSAIQKTYTFPGAAATLSQFPADTWFHIAVTVMRSTNTAYLYLNGVQVSSVSIAGTTGSVTSDASFRIGYDAGGAKFNGKIDDLRMYNRALSAGEIMTVYESNETKVNAPQDSKLVDGLVGFWTFNGKDLTSTTASDVSGRGNHGTLVNAPTATIGKVGQAIRFNGTSSYVEVPNSSSLNPTNLTVSAWARSDTSTWNDHGFLVSKRDAYIIHPTQGSTGVAFYIFTGSWNPTSCTPTQPITDWNLYTMTWDGTSLKCYINGVLGQTTTPAGPINTSDTGVLTIGRDDGIARFFNGSMDEVRMYSRALSAGEVQQLYLMGK